MTQLQLDGERCRPAPPGASRKGFLKGVGGGGAAAGLALLVAACGGSKRVTTPGGSDAETGAGLGTDKYGKGDVGIVKYALMLEHIEVDFYTKAIATGQLSGYPLSLAHSFLVQEQQHVARLEATLSSLGGSPSPPPKTSFQLSGGPAAIVGLAANIETVGAAAYLGQLDRIQSKQVLTTFASIHTVEGRHAAALNAATGGNISPEGAFAVAQPASNVATLIQPYLA